jgi:hypothetical protein
MTTCDFFSSNYGDFCKNNSQINALEQFLGHHEGENFPKNNNNIGTVIPFYKILGIFLRDK